MIYLNLDRSSALLDLQQCSEFSLFLCTPIKGRQSRNSMLSQLHESATISE